MQKSYRANPTLCREHGRQIVKQWLTKTLVQGWWGIISFFMNIVAVATDIAALRKVGKLGESQPVITRPMPDGETAGGFTTRSAPQWEASRGPWNVEGFLAIGLDGGRRCGRDRHRQGTRRNHASPILPGLLEGPNELVRVIESVGGECELGS